MAPRLAPDSLGPLLFECARLLDEVAQREVNRQAGGAIMTPAVARILPHLQDPSGVRPTVLARRIDVSKQAVGQSLRALDRLGFVEFVNDTGDARARLVRLTPLGHAAFAYGHGVLSFYEQQLARRVGAAQVRGLRRTLARVAPLLRDWAAHGAPARPTHVPPLRVRRRRRAP